MRVLNMLPFIFAGGIGVDEWIEDSFWYAHDGFEDKDVENISSELLGFGKDSFDVFMISDDQEGFWSGLDHEGAVFRIFPGEVLLSLE